MRDATANEAPDTVTEGVTPPAVGVTSRVTPTDRWSLRGRLRLGLALLVGLLFASATTTLAALRQYAAASAEVARDGDLARRARALGVDAREQYIHEVHTIVLGDRSHVTHHNEWAGMFRVETRRLSRELPEDRRSLDAIVASSLTVDRAFRQEILPAVDRGDRAAVRAAHDRAEAAVTEMIRRADALGARLEARAAVTRRRADRHAAVAAA
ncbi:MAG: hypothetical protein HY909_20965, partial [Deltaproteobacteria bacterium]|nr:hypothetical protein [Deltaproteobacteria bacterium]